MAAYAPRGARRNDSRLALPILTALTSSAPVLLPVASAFAAVRQPRSASFSSQHNILASTGDVGHETPPGDAAVTLQDLREKLELLKADLIESGKTLRPSDDRSLSKEEKVRETLLSTRLTDLNLNKTRIDASTLPGAGRGLFAVRAIAKGEVVTCYPGDALLCASPASSEGGGDENEDEFLDFENEEEDEEEWIDETVVWASHVNDEDRLDDDAVFHGADDSPPLTDYAVAVCDTYSVLGMPSLDADPAYFGHFANDGAGHFANQKADSDAGIEEGIAAYVLESVEASNAMHRSLDGMHMVTIAMKDIEAGEEVLVTYGPDYWMDHSCGIT